MHLVCLYTTTLTNIVEGGDLCASVSIFQHGQLPSLFHPLLCLVSTFLPTFSSIGFYLSMLSSHPFSYLGTFSDFSYRELNLLLIYLCEYRALEGLVLLGQLTVIER